MEAAYGGGSALIVVLFIYCYCWRSLAVRHCSRHCRNGKSGENTCHRFKIHANKIFLHKKNEN